MDTIQLSHGAGGEDMTRLIKEYILKNFPSILSEVSLHDLDDSAVINGIVFTTDSHTVKPLFFPGGDIGSLAVAGTINDISVMGAKPLALSCACLIEEGFSLKSFEKIIKSLGGTARSAEVPIITGDTKVVEKGALEQLMITTSAIGTRTKSLDRNFEMAGKRKKKWLQDSNLEVGDKIIVSGTIADHGIALLSFREGYGFETQIKSDVAPLNNLIEGALNVGGIVAAKDPTRGGLANTVNEFAEKSQVGLVINEEAIPIREGTLAACEMLGLDPLSIGNEGKVIIAVIPEQCDDVLKALRGHPLGKDAKIIGEVTKTKKVILETVVGGQRILEPPIEDPIPRIC
jgi:hydrogenase expression/formation protein HypE